jgi:hypothetical protein
MPVPEAVERIGAAQGVIYEVMNLVQLVERGCVDDDGEDLALRGSMSIAARELQRVAAELSDIIDGIRS